MSSKKKTKGKNNRNTRKQTVIHYPRNLTILCIIAVLFGMIVYHSLNVYSQESILEYPGEQSVAGYTVADVLEYVQFNPKRMARSIEVWVAASVKKGIISAEEGREFLSNYRSGLYGYTYLE